MAANHATNYSYKNCSFCIINYFETSSTVIDTGSSLFNIIFKIHESWQW